MNNSDKKNGPEGVGNSPNKTGIQSPSNDSFQQSLYIAAINLSLGLIGLVSPVTDDCDGLHYDFDFYHSRSGTLVKVLQTLDEHEWNKYSSHPSEPMILVDGHSAGFEFKECSCCGGRLLKTDDALAKAIHEYEYSFVFYDEDLWHLVKHEDLGSVWRVVTPYVIRVAFDDEDAADNE